jgi:ABC-type polysaccharide/polyol phosphate transport system ATPase subunit
MICASHDLASLERLCDRAIWLEQGRVRQVGACAEVVTAYRASLRAASRAAA